MTTKTLAYAAVALAALTLSGCGGDGGGDAAGLEFLGSVGGDWLQDGDAAQPGLQLRRTCGPLGGTVCGVNLQQVGRFTPMFGTAFDLAYSNATLPGCPATGQGRADGRRLVLDGGCFSGSYVTLNEAVSDDGRTRLFFDYAPPLAGGVWVSLQGGRRFAFNNNTDGCELLSPKVRVTVVLSEAEVQNPAGPFETTIRAFGIGNDTPYSGQFVGVSGMRLTRGSEVLELVRRQGNEGCL